MTDLPFQFIREDVHRIIENIPQLRPILFVLADDTFRQCMEEVCVYLARPRYLPYLRALIQSGPIHKFQRLERFGFTERFMLERNLAKSLLLNSKLPLSVIYPLVESLCTFSSSLSDAVRDVLIQKPDLELFKRFESSYSLYQSLLVQVAVESRNEEIIQYILTKGHSLSGFLWFKLAQTNCIRRFVDQYHDTMSQDEWYHFLGGIVFVDNLEMFKLFLPTTNMDEFMVQALRHNSPNIAQFILDTCNVQPTNWLLVHALCCKSMFERICALFHSKPINWFEIAKSALLKKLCDHKLLKGSYVDASVMDFVLSKIEDLDQQKEISFQWLIIVLADEMENLNAFPVLAKYHPDLVVPWGGGNVSCSHRSRRELLKSLKYGFIPYNEFTIEEVQDMIERKELDPRQYVEDTKFRQVKLHEKILHNLAVKRVTEFELEEYFETQSLTDLVVEYM